MMPTPEELRLEVRQLASAYLLIHPEDVDLPSDVLRHAAAEVVFRHEVRHHSPKKAPRREQVNGQ